MSHFDYIRSGELDITDEPFYGLVMAAMRRADTANLARLRAAFPDTWAELDARYHAPGGHLPGDHEPALCAVCAFDITPGKDHQ